MPEILHRASRVEVMDYWISTPPGFPLKEGGNDISGFVHVSSLILHVFYHFY